MGLRVVFQKHSGRGKLLQYFPALKREFDCDFTLLRNAVLLDEGAGSQVELIEPSLFSSIEMKRAGHRMLLAKALLKLQTPAEKASWGTSGTVPGKQQVADLRSSVRMEIHERLPQLLQEAMQSKATERKRWKGVF